MLMYIYIYSLIDLICLSDIDGLSLKIQEPRTQINYLVDYNDQLVAEDKHNLILPLFFLQLRKNCRKFEPGYWPDDWGGGRDENVHKMFQHVPCVQSSNWKGALPLLEVPLDWILKSNFVNSFLVTITNKIGGRLAWNPTSNKSVNELTIHLSIILFFLQSAIFLPLLLS